MTLGVTGAVSAQELPKDYWNRFNRIQAIASTRDGFGVRYFPLPLEVDLRVTLAKRPHYWEYGIGTRMYDTTFFAGIYDNGPDAQKGIPRVEATHDPFKGYQATALWQGEGALSRFSVGHAWTFEQDKVRVLQNVGYATQNAVKEPFTETIASGYFPKSFDKVNTALSVTGRAYTYPLAQKAQASVDLTLSANVTPVPGLTFDGFHMERFAAGESVIPGFGFGRYRETALNTTYRMQYAADPEFAFGGVRERFNHYWTSNSSWAYGDLFFRTKYLPVLFGPSVGYYWSPDGKSNKWVISLTTAPK